ncbi:Iron-dependent repressor IdeR/DtxR [hydrothermal vent metagenome]|uniref:Iron-dependent repressor IdeR/DtxR n=1 Tax=hydrothermal vent metagenome TaxID=652676 RepID=A0A3B1BSW6_9ZZZZ
MTHERKNYEKDELLEILWHLDECHDLTLASLREHDNLSRFETTLNEFANNGAIKFDGTNIELTAKGRESAQEIIRRHRLAERLLVDVLGKTPEETEQAACEFEHILAPELVESICILLGHPKTCPHGSPIPEGKCCSEAKKSVGSLIIPLSEIKPNQSAKISSINTEDETRMEKLLSLGIVPGTMVKVTQKNPALVIEINQTQVALESSIGLDIKVWRPTP